MMSRSIRVLLCFGLLAVAAVAGCSHGPAPVEEPDVPEIPVSVPVQRHVTEYVEYTGRTEAVNPVDIRARATGYVIRTPFKEGAEVKKGDLLFEIDPRPYKAALDMAEAQLRLNQARLRLARDDYERGRRTTRVPGTVSPQDLDTLRSTAEQAVAAVKASEANVATARLDLSFTKVIAPIDGQVGRYYRTAGNLVNKDQTVLTTVMSLDPMYVTFDMDERTLLRIKNAIIAGKLAPLDNSTDLPLYIGLEGERGFPHRGTINFMNNQLSSSTGTIRVRGVFRNPKVRGVRLLAPGMFVRVRLPIGEPYPALLVADQAIGSDQELKFVYVLDADNKVRYQRIEKGPLQDDGLRVITSGLKPKDRVVLNGLQLLRGREGLTVEPQGAPMPTLAQPATAPATVVRGHQQERNWP
jgi:multidrug efflux system membrane fusion protein